MVPMQPIGDTVTAVLTSMTGLGWALYFGAGALVVGVTLAVEQLKKGRTHG
jgi:hypothetical protein